MAAREYPPDFGALRIQLDRAWSVDDLVELLGDFAALYEMRARLELEPESLDYWPAVRWRDRSWPGLRPRWSRTEWTLDIGRIEYGSPGFVDLVGIGKVVEQIRLFVEKLIDLPATRRREELENEARKADIEGKKIENARNFVRLALEGRAAGLTDDQVRSLVYEVDGAQERILRLIEQGQVTGVEKVGLPGGGDEPERR